MKKKDNVTLIIAKLNAASNKADERGMIISKLNGKIERQRAQLVDQSIAMKDRNKQIGELKETIKRKDDGFKAAGGFIVLSLLSICYHAYNCAGYL